MQNEKRKITRIKFFIAVLSFTLLIFSLAPMAQAVSWWPLVPCGTSVNPAPCNRCDLFKLSKNIIDFVLVGLMPPIATILFVWGGFLILMGGAKPDWITKGRTIFFNTVMGIAIISASWLITNTIIRSIAADNVAPEWWKFECRVTVPPAPVPPVPPAPPAPPQPPPPQPPGPQPQPPPVEGAYTIITSSLPDGVVGQSYNQTISTSGGTLPISWTQIGSLPPGLNFDTFAGVISGTPTTAGTYNFTIKAEDSSSPQQSATKQLSIKVNPVVAGDLCSQPAQLATSNNEPYPRKNAPELVSLINCIQSKLPGQSLGSQFTFDDNFELCNYTRGQKSCTTSCSHTVNSCHYGGRAGNQGALAVDFGNELIGDNIIQAAIACGVPSGKARCENPAGVNVGCAPGSGANHVHVSAASCDAN
ncbi:MAG: putative Ig domain-containing protein [Candidatus Yanofskybacteria bacterium]|nr:putative Ig domain-containing protein [Candidatus Yanofskybacteria bacterium]